MMQVRSGFEVIVGGGLGRTPMVGRKVLRDFLPEGGPACPMSEAIVQRLQPATVVAITSTRRGSRSLVHENGLEKIQELVGYRA